MALQELLFLSFNQVQLDMAIDCLSSVGRTNGIQCTPFFLLFKVITDNLDLVSLRQWAGPLHDFDKRLIFVSYIGVEDG